MKNNKKTEPKGGSRTCKTTQTEQSPLSAGRPTGMTLQMRLQGRLYEAGFNSKANTRMQWLGRFNASLMTHVLELKFSKRLLLYRLAIPNPSCIW